MGNGFGTANFCASPLNFEFSHRLQRERSLRFAMTPAEIERRAEEEAFEQGFHGIPDPRVRAVMSPERLAIELSKLEKGSPPYILLEHELNLRLAKEQAKATLSAGWLGAGATILAVFIGAALGYLVGTSQPKEPSGGLGAKHATEAAGAASASAGPLKVVEVPATGGSAQKANKASDEEKPKP